LQGNGYCDTPCDNEACEFDHGDCDPREGTIGPTPIYHFNGTGERLDGDKYNYVQEQWAKADFDASPLEANDLRKHLRIGCYYINRVPNELVFQQCWDLLEEIVFDLELMENVSIFTPYNQTGVPCERTARVRYERDDDYVYGDMNPSQCITDCFLYDNMLYEESVSTSGGQEQTSALCQCLNDDWMAQYTLTEGYGDCSELVQVFREYDYRASIGNAQWDVARRYLYQVVMVQHPVKSIGRQHYIHAINAHENKPAWDFDYRLDRIIYNYVWDFAKSRLVCLSTEEPSDPLELTMIYINTTDYKETGQVAFKETYWPIQRQLVAFTGLMVDQLANIEGLGCMDILWGIYITVVPAYFSSTGDVVHSLVAINLADSSVLGVYTFPLRFFSLEYNSISHNLHGVAKDLNGMNAFYYLCEITVAYTLVNEVELPYYTFICSPEFLSELPDYIHHNYLAQSAVEHHFNISWFSYKKIPWDDEIFIHEVYHDTGVQERWR
jgi:hypothetical protein